MIVAPAWAMVIGDAVLVTARAPAWSATTAADDGLELTGTPPSVTPPAVAVFAMTPLSRSACVVTYVAVQIVFSPGASTVLWQTGVSSGPAGAVKTSATAMSLTVTLPELVTMKV